jgi:phosphoglycolate phosphatase
MTSPPPLAGISVLIDMDGTLTDSAPGILASLRYALDTLGLAPMPADARHRFVGPPLHETFSHFVPPEGIDQAVATYREYYIPTGMFENELYPGVREMLLDLRAAGASLAVATSKAEPFAQQIVEHFGLGGMFAAVCGSMLDGTRSRKADVIAEALRQLGDPSPAGTVMIGDRSHDIHGAHEHDIVCYGAGWGYGSPEELAGALCVLSEPQQVLPALVARFAAAEGG